MTSKSLLSWATWEFFGPRSAKIQHGFLLRQQAVLKTRAMFKSSLVAGCTVCRRENERCILANEEEALFSPTFWLVLIPKLNLAKSAAILFFSFFLYFLMICWLIRYMVKVWSVCGDTRALHFFAFLIKKKQPVIKLQITWKLHSHSDF